MVDWIIKLLSPCMGFMTGMSITAIFNCDMSISLKIVSITSMVIFAALQVYFLGTYKDFLFKRELKKRMDG